MVCLHGQSKNTGQTLIWSHLTRNSGLNTCIYLLQMTSWIFFFGFTIFAHEIFQKLEPKKRLQKRHLDFAGNRRFCRSGHCSKHGRRHVARFFPSCWGCWDMPMFQMSAKGEWGIKQLWYSFLQCSRCDIEILKNLFMPAFFLAIIVFCWRQFDAFH